MLTVLPALILLLAAAIVIILHRLKPNFGQAWFFSTLMVFVSLGLMIAYHWISPAEIGNDSWLPITTGGDQIQFRLNELSWSYSLSVVGLLFAVLMTAPVRLKYNSNPSTWSANLAVAGTALLSILASTPLTLVLTWTVLDLIDLIVTIASNRDVKIDQAAIISFVFRLAGSFLVIWAMGVSQAEGMDLRLETVSPRPALLLLLAVGLRLGVLPLSLPFYSEALRRRGIGSMIRLAVPAASLGVLANLPATVAPLNISTFLLALVGIAVIYGAVMWLVSSDEVSGRQFWVIAMAGMAIGSVIRGQPEASIAWGIMMVLSGGLLFLYSTRPRVSIGLPVLGLIGLSGLPFTPSASGWFGMITLPFSLPDILFIFAHAILMLGYIRHFLRSGDQPSEVERWTQVAYTIGLLMLVALGWLLGVLGWKGSFSPGIWWGSLASILLACGAGLTFFFLWRKTKDTTWLTQGWFYRLSRQIGNIVSTALRFNWLYQFLGWLFTQLRIVIGLITTMLEGAGGLLWVFVLLVLLITVVQVIIR